MSAGETWALGHRPALDGVRGLAILFVVVGHLQAPPLLDYAYVGVDIFFTLSGFLITTLLLAEHERTGGRTNYGAFYIRRARRLLPALVVFVAVVSLATLAAGTPLREVGAAAGSVMFYVANFSSMLGTNLGVMQHGWSLAVEEQFYLAWPLTLVVLAPLRRRGLIAALVTAALVVTVWRVWLVAHIGGLSVLLERGSFERSVPILLGCALAVVMSSRQERASRPRLATVGVVVLATLPWFLFVGLGNGIAPAVTGILTAAVIYCSCQGVGAKWLSHRSLVLVGQRSYGLYLWHFPLMAPLLTVLDGWAWFAVAVVTIPLAWGVTCLSWRYVELPFLRRGPVGAADVVPMGRLPDSSLGSARRENPAPTHTTAIAKTT